MELTFRGLAKVNRARCDQWHAGMEPWSAADWSNAMVGEAGEAANKVKKLRRLQTSGKTPKPDAMDRRVEEIMEEIADTIIYADLLAHHLGRDLEPYVIAKFNKVSEEREFPHRL